MKPRILILTDWFLPGYKAGGPIQSVKNLCEVIGGEVNIDIICGDRDLGDILPYDGVVLNQWIQREKYRVMYARPQDPTSMNTALADDYDRIYLNSFFSVAFTIRPLWRLRSMKKLSKVILAPRGMLGAGALQLKPTKKQLFIKAFKLLGLHKQVCFHSTDASETKDIQSALGKGVELKEIANIPVRADFAPKSSITGKGHLVFASRISPKKNLHFLLESLHRLNVPFQLDIYGQPDDQAYFAKCEKLWSALGATYHGAVSNESLLDALRNADFFVLPTLNENFGHVIIESLAVGTPVLISDQCPWTDIWDAGAGWVMPLNNPDLWEKCLREAIELDSKTYATMSAAAIRYVEEKLDISNLRHQYLAMFSGN